MRGCSTRRTRFVGMTLQDFARDVGPVENGPVWVQGHQTRCPAPNTMRTVRAPSRVMSFRADEMIVECGAGTPIDELQAAVGEHGQYVNLPVRSTGSGTVGGALALGQSDLRRLGRGAVRDSVLRARFVGHDGKIVTAGGPTVKNVSGFDLCRLLVGSRGTLGFFGEVLLRTRPLPRASQWFTTSVSANPVVNALVRVLYRPAAVLWNGSTVVVCMEGHEADIENSINQVRLLLGLVLQETTPLDLATFRQRWSVAPDEIPHVVSLASGRCWAEVGVGTIHHCEPQPLKNISPGVGTITRRLLDTFDPTGRLNPGQAPHQGAIAAH